MLSVSRHDIAGIRVEFSEDARWLRTDNALYSRNYAKFAELAGISFTTYYTDYNGMRGEDRGSKRFTVGGGGHGGRGGGATTWNYRSSFDWADVAGVGRSVEPASSAEQLLFVCHAMGKSCKVQPPPPPAPVSPGCQAAVRRDCGSVAPAGCSECVPQHVGDLIHSGCPQGSDAAQRVIAFCQTLGHSQPATGRCNPSAVRLECANLDPSELTTGDPCATACTRAMLACADDPLLGRDGTMAYIQERCSAK